MHLWTIKPVVSHSEGVSRTISIQHRCTLMPPYRFSVPS